MATLDELYEAEKKRLKDAELQTKIANEAEIQRQTDKYNKEIEQQRSDVLARGTISSEQRRILDNMTGYQNSGTAVQNVIDIATNTSGNIGGIDSARTEQLGEFSRQKSDVNTGYNNRITNIENEYNAALLKQKYEQAEAARLQAEQRAYEKQQLDDQRRYAEQQNAAQRAYEKQLRDEDRAYNQSLGIMQSTPINKKLTVQEKRIQEEQQAAFNRNYINLGAQLQILADEAANKEKNMNLFQKFVLPYKKTNPNYVGTVDKAKADMKKMIDDAFDSGKISADQAEKLTDYYGIPL